MTRVKFKICGLTNQEDASHAASVADALGFIFYAKSPRYISPSKANKIIANLPPFVSKVAVFVNPADAVLEEVLTQGKFNLIQIHGDENPERINSIYQKFNIPIIKAFRLSNKIDENFLNNFIQEQRMLKKAGVIAYLLDKLSAKAYGGLGETINWQYALKFKTISELPIILAGGIGANNGLAAIDALAPYALDINSQVEKSAGIKDHDLIDNFFQQIKKILCNT